MRWLISLLLLIVLSSRGFCTPATALHSSAEYARKNPTQMQYVRFFDLSCYPENYREEILKVLAFQLNSISTEPEIAIPKVISGEVVAVNYLDYDSDNKRLLKVHEKLENVDPYFHFVDRYEWPGGFDKRYNKIFAKGNYVLSTAIVPIGGDPKDLQDLIYLTHSNVPIIRADFWLAQVSRQLSLNNRQTGVGYYDWLNVKARADFEKLVVFQEKEALATKKEIRAAIKDSGISQQNRQLFRLPTLNGSYWVTLDTKDSTGKGNAIENPIRGEMHHDAEEIYGTLPNGLFAYFLSDANGGRQDSAPDFIGPNDALLRTESGSHDGRIHVNLSCLECHVDGLRNANDWFRKNMRSPLAFQTPDYRKFQEFKRTYFRSISDAIELDRTIFANSVKQCNGMTLLENSKAMSKAWTWYAVEGVTAEKAARELGITEDHLIKCLKSYAVKSGQIDLITSSFLANPSDTIRRDQWEELQPLVRSILK